jgi:hypothetical protein
MKRIRITPQIVSASANRTGSGAIPATRTGGRFLRGVLVISAAASLVCPVLAQSSAAPAGTLGPAVPEELTRPVAAPPPDAAAPANLRPATRPAADRPDAPPVALGPRFESMVHGIAFNAPADCKENRNAAAQNQIVEYVNEDKNWSLRVSRLSLERPTPLTAMRDPKDNHEVQGLLENTIAQIRSDIPTAEIVRQDVTNVSENFVGLIILRYALGAQHWLRQQAILQANDQLYYVFNFTTPAGAQREDESERVASATFSAIIDSIKLIDRTPIKEDQNARLYRTRALLMEWTDKKLTSVLVPRQYLRLTRNGKDIGWTYVEEMTGRQRRALTGTPRAPTRNQPADGSKVPDDGLITDDGLVIYTRTWTKPENDRIFEAGSELFTTFDRRLERWAQIAGATEKGQLKSQALELGQTRREMKRLFAPVLKDEERMGISDAKDPNNPRYRPAEVYTIDVQTISKTGNAAPIKRDLPPWYLPAALGHLLPRLVPLTQPRTFLFASYISAKREVMHRYVDVGQEATVTIGSQTVRAVPVSERIGLEGAPIVHYLSPEGKYLGTINKADGLTVLPSDVQTLLRLWPDADLKVQEIQPPPGTDLPRADAAVPAANTAVDTGDVQGPRPTPQRHSAGGAQR